MPVGDKENLNDSYSRTSDVSLDNRVDDIHLSDKTNPISITEDKLCYSDDPTTDPVLRAISKYKKQCETFNRKVVEELSPTDYKSSNQIKPSETATIHKNDDRLSAEIGNSNKKSKMKIFVLGDSIVKNINGWSISEILKKNHNVYVRSFSGSKVRCMVDYAKPCIRENDPDHIILHVGTNDLNSENNAEQISKSILDLAKDLTSQKRSVTVSGIVPRNDEWNNKAAEVNEHLRVMCQESGISFIEHSKYINPRKHLNRSKIHLNEKGTFILGNKLLDYIKSFCK